MVNLNKQNNTFFWNFKLKTDHVEISIFGYGKCILPQIQDKVFMSFCWYFWDNYGGKKNCEFKIFLFVIIEF